MTTAPDVELVGTDVPHESSFLHVTGTAQFADDVVEPEGTVHVVLGLSPVAHGRLVGIDVAGMLRMPGVVAVLTADDFPGRNDCGTITHDEPILASGQVSYAGQPAFAVVAEDRESAASAAAHGEARLVIEELPPELDPLAAHAAGHHAVPPFRMERTSGSGLRAAIDTAPHRLQGTFESGGQEHVYLETHVCLAVPTDEGGLALRSSTQHPSEVQAIVAASLGLARNVVQVECRRLGGGFGGKQHQAAQFACLAALAARVTGRPAKLRLGRAQDNEITGKRHAYHSTFDVGYDDEGRILGLDVTHVSQAGYSAGLTEPVLLKSVVQSDSAYWLPNVSVHGYGARTNTHSATAMRGFGAPQGALVTEVVLDSVARALGLDPAEVRLRNYYWPEQSDDPGEWGTTTPYGQKVQGSELRRLVAELTVSSEYAARRREIREFNDTSPVIKRGIALTPMKFGISYELRYLNQAGALVHVYTDGSVTVSHSGIEMGQGVHTKVLQVVAQEPRRAGRSGAHLRHRHRQGPQHLRHGRLHLLRPQRHGGPAGGAAHSRPARRRGRPSTGGRPRRGRLCGRARQRPGGAGVVRRHRPGRPRRLRPALVRRLLLDTGAVVGRGDHAGAPLLLLLLRGVRQRGRGGHPDR